MALAAVAAFLAVGIALVLQATNVLEPLELKSVDARFALRGAQRPPAGIVIVGIDALTFSRLQLQWPFPRSLHARVINQLRRDGARAIVYDVQFTEPTTPVDGGRAAKRAAIEQDDDLINAVRHAGNVVLASSEVGPRGETMIFGGGGILSRVRARAGAAVFPSDSDGVDRRMLFSFRGLRSLGVVGAEVATGRSISPDAFAHGKAWIDFAGPAGTVPEVSFASVLRGEVPASRFAGQTVVVGATVSNLQDVHATPFDGRGLMSGPELTANAILTAEDGFPLRTGSGYLGVLLILAFGAFGPVAVLRLPPGRVLGAGIAVAVVYAFAAQLAFQGGSIIPLCGPLGALLLGCGGAVAVDSLGERRRLQAVERRFGPLRGERSKFFISYRRSQSNWPAKALNDSLVKRVGGSRVFLDKAAMDAGDIWPQEIEKASAECGVMLVLMGPRWLDAKKPDGTRRLDDPLDWVRREVQAGLDNEACLVVPVYHDGAEMPPRDELPDPLKPLVECQAISFANEEIDAEVGRLVASVEMGRRRSYFGQRSVGRSPV